MLSRTSIVNHISIDTVIFSSVIEVGDSTIIQGFSRALAVQREADFFFGNEGNFESFAAFSKPLPIPKIFDDVNMHVTNLNPVIKVDDININGVSTSSVVHIGSSEHIQMESRLMHIRQLLPR